MIPIIFCEPTCSPITKYENIPVKTGIRFENTLTLATPIERIAIVNKTNANDEHKIARLKSENIISPLGFTILKLSSSNQRNKGKK